MAPRLIHRFEENGTRFALDPETCFCFECDAISWDVLEHYPETPINRIYHLLGIQYSLKELSEVVGELEWLRSTRSILKTPSQEEAAKRFEFERGVKRLSVRLPRGGGDAAPPPSTWTKWMGEARKLPSGNRQRVTGNWQLPGAAREIGERAIALLLGRTGTQAEPQLQFLEDEFAHNPDLLADLCARALTLARLAGKNLTVSVRVCGVRVAKPPPALEEHALDAVLEFQTEKELPSRLRALASEAPETLSRWAKTLQPGDGAAGRIIARPNHAAFGDLVPELDRAGFTVIELDLDSAYVANPDLDPRKMLESLAKSSRYYAQRLLEQHYFRLEPMAALFMRVYEGAPLRRADPAGTHELAVDETGAVYPSPHFAGLAEFRLGSVLDGALDEAAIRRFEDVGSLTTPACLRCWARNLCGGGCAAVHHRLSASFRAPHEPWCEAQRAWTAAAIASFQMLSSRGVNFTRIYGALTRAGRPSLFALARAAFGMTIGVRPIEEADAELLVKWENWTEAAYFLGTERGLLLATKYDREMDSLHPEGLDREVLLLRKTGEPLGLFKLRPDRLSGMAQGWFYFHREADYASESTRKGVRHILRETGGQQALRRLTVQAAERETALQGFLEAVGFEKLGVQREALYLHGAYHDVAVYGISLDRL